MKATSYVFIPSSSLLGATRPSIESSTRVESSDLEDIEANTYSYFQASPPDVTTLLKNSQKNNHAAPACRKYTFVVVFYFFGGTLRFLKSEYPLVWGSPELSKK